MAGNRRFLLLAYHFPPENITGANRPYRFFRYLPEQGYDAQVITAYPQERECPNIHYVEDTARARAESRSGFHWHTERILRKFILPGELGLLWTRDAAQRAIALCDVNPDGAAIYSTSPPVAVHMAALQVKSARPKVKWVADFRDPLCGNPFRRQGKVPELADTLLEKRIFRYADVIVANTDSAAEMMRRRHPQYAAKVHHIWNGFDPQTPLEAAPIPARNYKLITHAGSLYGARHPGALLASLARLIDCGAIVPEDVRVRLMGTIAAGCIRDQELFDRMVNAGVVECIPRNLPRRDADAANTTSDGLLLLDLNEFDTDLQVPAKLFEFLQIGRPVLAWTTRNSPCDRILAQSGIRYRSIYVDDDVERVDRGVLEFLSLPSEPLPMSEWAESQFDARRQTATLCGFVERL